MGREGWTPRPGRMWPRRRTGALMRHKKWLALLAGALLALAAYMNRRKLGIIATNAAQGHLRAAGGGEVVASAAQVRRLLPLDKIPSEEGDRLPPGGACRRAWQRGSSEWFDGRYHDDVAPLWTKGNRDLKEDIRKWWLVSQVCIRIADLTNYF